jgi:hypothetical protein
VEPRRGGEGEWGRAPLSFSSIFDCSPFKDMGHSSCAARSLKVSACDRTIGEGIEGGNQPNRQTNLGSKIP